MMKKNIQLYTMALFLFLCTLTTAFSSCVFAAETEGDPTVIRVGYTSNYATVESPIVKDSEGFGYEYLNKIFSYADGDYELEFVCCQWEEIRELLVNGEIDIMGPTTYTQENAAYYAYPEESFGKNILFLSAIEEKLTSYNNYENIAGSKIAVQENNPNEHYLYEFLEKNDIEAEIVYFVENDYVKAMEDLDCDLCMTSSLQHLDRLTPIATLGVLDFYYVTDSNNQELMDVIDLAMIELENNEFMYPEQLYLKYYNYAISKENYVSEEEYDLLQSQRVYRVGIENAVTPICYADEDGELRGVAVDILEMIAKEAGISYEVVELAVDATEEELAELDFYFISVNKAGEESATKSVAYSQVPFFMIERQLEKEATVENLGVLKYYSTLELTKDSNGFDREIYEYNFVVDMQRAYNKGEIDSFIVTNSTLNAIRTEFDDLDFVSEATDFSLDLAITFPMGYDAEKIDVFNKIISQLDNTQVGNSISTHSIYIAKAIKEPFDLWSFVKENIIWIQLIILGILTCIYLVKGRHKKEMALAVNVDKLTGLATQSAFLDQAEEVIEGSKNNTWAIISMDIDNFKYINESFGYEVGSKVLVSIASSLRQHRRSARVISRNNGDNFLLLVERNNLMKAIDFSIESGQGLSDILKETVGEAYNITFSIGVYEVEDKHKDISFMVDCANIARGLGKNIAQTTVHRFSSVIDQARAVNNDIVANMVNAIEKDEFVLQYQPKVNLHTNEVTGAEALVRWLRDGKMVPPLKFIPLFERNGFIEQLDYYVLAKACDFIQRNPETPKISINFSGFTVTTTDMADKIIDIVAQYGVAPAKVDIEITETAFVEQFEYSLEKIERLREHGFSISMDDFGAGISSLNRLKNIPIDIMKIDREFIVDSIENPRGSQIIKNVLQMAKDLNLETVAEGIETKEQALFLKNLGCDVGQGYYFSRALSEDVFLEWLKADREKEW